MKNLTIGQRIIAGFTAIVVICAALGAIAVIQLRSISKLATVTTTEVSRAWIAWDALNQRPKTIISCWSRI